MSPEREGSPRSVGPDEMLEWRPFSEFASERELHFREEIQPVQSSALGLSQYEKYRRAIVRGGRPAIYALLRRHIRIAGTILEIGSGSCWLSALASREPTVERVVAVDFSRYILEHTAPRVIAWLDGRQDRITRVVGDFYRIGVPDGYFDLVMADAVLHHATHLPQLLQEMRRVLKAGGILAAVREPVLPWLGLGRDKRFGRTERQHGVTENIYPAEKWGREFCDAGFALAFLNCFHIGPVLPHPLRFLYRSTLACTPLRWLNGILFGRYLFIARRLD